MIAIAFCCFHCTFGFVLSVGLVHGLYPDPLSWVQRLQVIDCFVAADCWSGSAACVLAVLCLGRRRPAVIESRT